MSKIAKATIPWPWAVKEHGSPPFYSYDLIDARGEVICSFYGRDARSKIEALVEMAAENAAERREQGR